MQPELHCNSGGFGFCEEILLRRPEEAGEFSGTPGAGWPGKVGVRRVGGRGSHPKLRSIFKKKFSVEDGWGCASEWAAAAAAPEALDLTGVGGPLHFPQLDAAVEPDDGAEGERWQHAPIQTAAGKPASRVLLEQRGWVGVFIFFFSKKGGAKKSGGGRRPKSASGGRTCVVGSLWSDGEF